MLVPILFLAAFCNGASQRALKSCQACEKLAVEVDRRLEETARRGGQVTVGHRFGPNGESVHKKIIDYLDSERRYMDVFDENICEGNPHKAECYRIFDENESNFHSWFFKEGRENFLERVCFQKMTGCSADILAAAVEKEKAVDQEKDKKEAVPHNQVIVSPADDLKAVSHDTYELIKEHQAATAQHTDTLQDPPPCFVLAIPKTLSTPLMAFGLVLLVVVLGFMAAKCFQKSEEPLLQRPKRRGSHKIIKEL